MGGVMTHRAGVFNQSSAEAFAADEWYRAAVYIDADGQSDGTGYVADESSYAHTIAYSGNAQITSNRFVFDGTGDYLSIGGTSKRWFWVPGGPFTIELRGVAFDAATECVLFSAYDAVTNGRGWRVAYTSAGELIFDASSDGSSAVVASYTWTPLTDGTEYDITGTWDGSTLRLYLDGDFVASAAFSSLPYAAKQRLLVGAGLLSGSLTYYFNGSMRAARFTKGLAYVTGEGSITLPTLPWPTSQSTTDANWGDVLLLLTASDDGTIRDESKCSWRLQQFGNTAVSTSVEPFADANSVALDGSGDYLSILDDPLLEIGSNNVTVEAFVRHTVNNASHTYAGKWQTTGNNRSWIFQYRGDQATDVMRATYDADGASGSSVTLNSGAWTPTVDTWYHVAWSRSTNVHRFFAGGTQQGTDQTNAVAAFNSTAPLWIGAVEAGENMNGYLSELRITKAARYTSSFTAPSAAFPRG